MSCFKNAMALAAASTLLAAPLSLATSDLSFARQKKHHGTMAKKQPPSEMKTTSPDSKQTPSGGQPGGPADKS